MWKCAQGPVLGPATHVLPAGLAPGGGLSRHPEDPRGQVTRLGLKQTHEQEGNFIACVDEAQHGRGRRGWDLLRTIKLPSADVGHVAEEGCLHAAGAELVHPQRGLMLQGRAARVEGEVHAVVEQAAEGGHIEVGEAHEAPREVGGVVEGAEDAPKLSVEQGLGNAPGRETRGTGRAAQERPAGPPAPGPLLTSVPAAPSSRQPAPAGTPHPGKSGRDKVCAGCVPQWQPRPSPGTPSHTHTHTPAYAPAAP